MKRTGTAMPRMLLDAARRTIGLDRAWYADLCDYYGVTPQQALELGTRKDQRRPSLPASPTTHAVSGATFEELWEAGPRSRPEEIQSFYREIGAWLSFRQVVYHRSRSFPEIGAQIRTGSRFCEYGAGVAPVAHWILGSRRKMPFRITVVDVPCEHFTFGAWRMGRRIQDLKAPVDLHVAEVKPDRLPLTDVFDVITILEVLEHVHNPFDVIVHLTEHLSAGGMLWENFIVHDESAGSNLPVAQTERPRTYDFLRSHYDLVSGEPPEAALGGRTRCWRKR